MKKTNYEDDKEDEDEGPFFLRSRGLPAQKKEKRPKTGRKS